jgi:hypothetical protein
MRFSISSRQSKSVLPKIFQPKLASEMTWAQQDRF